MQTALSVAASPGKRKRRRADRMLALGAVVVARSKKNTLRFGLASQLCKKSIRGDNKSVRRDRILALHKLCADESAGERSNWVPADAREMGSGEFPNDWP